MKKIVKILIALLITICVLVASVFIAANIYSKNIASSVNMKITNATEVADGIYEGDYELSPVKVSVRVTVLDERITDITILEHQNGLGDKAESIVQDVIGQQSLEVDSISGATSSSKTILKAVENALEKGRNRR